VKVAGVEQAKFTRPGLSTGRASRRRKSGTIEGMGEEPWAPLALIQDGVVAHRQLRALGLTKQQARTRVENGRWQALGRGVYLTHSGPVPEMARVWAAVLYGGSGALAGGRTALWLARVTPGGRCPEPIEICVPRPRQVSPMPGLSIRRVRDLRQRGDYVKSPPRLRVEHAVLDVSDREPTAEAVCDVVLRAVQQRLTTATRIRAALAGRARQRWRALIVEVLAEAEEGVQSPLERRYLDRVERVHRLPRGVRNQPRVEADGRRRYRDIRYPSWRLVVEVDGREAHPVSEAFRDLRRDNGVAVEGQAVLRYGWRDVAGRPCAVAGQVSAVLAARGWIGRPRACGRGCAVGS